MQTTSINTEAQTENTQVGARIRVKKAIAPRQAPIRGFYIKSAGWVQSILSRQGASLLPENFPKLRATAAAHGIESSEDSDQSELVALVSSKMSEVQEVPAENALEDA